jgi:hypothetical protein
VSLATITSLKKTTQSPSHMHSGSRWSSSGAVSLSFVPHNFWTPPAAMSLAFLPPAMALLVPKQNHSLFCEDTEIVYLNQSDHPSRSTTNSLEGC